MPSLRAVRTDRQLSIRALARAAGVAASTVYLIEMGRTLPHPGTMRALAAALRVEPQEVDEFRQAIERAKTR
jgi:transcriptional regulator with XRE-family HTH domain